MIQRHRTQTDDAPSIWSRGFVTLFVMNFFQGMGGQICTTVLPLYAASMGATASIVGVVSGVFAATALLSRPFLGPAFLSFSNKRMLIAAYAVMCAAMFLYAIAPSIEVIIAARLLHGLGVGCSAPLAMSIVSNILPQERLSSGISVYMVGFAVSQVIGPAFGIWFSQQVGYEATFFVSAVSLACAIVLACTVSVPEPDERPRYRISLTNVIAREGVKPALVLTLIFVAFSCVSAFVVIYGGLRGVDNMGIYFVVYAVCLLFSRPAFGKLSDRAGAKKTLIPAVVLFAASMAILAFADSLPWFMAAALVSACGYGVVTPLMSSIAMSGVDADRRSLVSNTTYIGMDLGNLIGPYAGGLVIEAAMAAGSDAVSAYSLMWVVSIAPIMLGLALIFNLGKPHPRPEG